MTDQELTVGSLLRPLIPVYKSTHVFSEGHFSAPHHPTLFNFVTLLYNVEETRRMIGKLKCGKAGGVCDIRGEMLKAGEVTVQWLTAIFNVVWRTGVTPKE